MLFRSIIKDVYSNETIYYFEDKIIDDEISLKNKEDCELECMTYNIHINGCNKCKYFMSNINYNRWNGEVIGYCRDLNNNDFYGFAKLCGRGIIRKDYKKSPKWCQYKYKL